MPVLLPADFMAISDCGVGNWGIFFGRGLGFYAATILGQFFFDFGGEIGVVLDFFGGVSGGFCGGS